MTDQHTQEPWAVADEVFDNDGMPETVITGLDGRAAIAVTLDFGQNNPGMREANARRIVACVNYCRNLDTEGMETAVQIGDAAKAMTDRLLEKQLELIGERDALLAALTKITSYPQDDGAMKLAQFCAEQAIAKVKGGAQ